MERSLAPMLIGRDDALSRLLQQLGVALTGVGHVVFLSGEAGVGKTSLTRAFLATASERPGVDSLLGQCYESDVAVPYAPFVSALAALSRHGGTDFGADTAVLAPLCVGAADVANTPAIEPSVARRQLYHSLTRVLSTVGLHRGRVLVLEDLHWADATSRDVLVPFARGIQDIPILLLCTYRREAVERHHPLAEVIAQLAHEGRSTEISLKALDLPETTRLLKVTLDRAIPPDFAARMHERTGGNPFFIEEILRSLIDEETLDACLQAAAPGSALKDAEIPLTIRASILGRFAELDPTARQVAQTAAVLGRAFEYEQLRSLTALPEATLTASLERCIELQLMQEDRQAPGERYHFRHALTRETIYSDLSGRERLSKHRTALGYYEWLAVSAPEAVTEELAYHSLRARELERARHYAHAAGARAMQVYAYRDALAQYETALSLTPQPAIRERADLHVDIAGALRPLRRHRDYTAHWHEARQLYAQLGDRKGEAAMCLELAAAAWEANESAKTFATAQVAIDLLITSDATSCELARAYAMVTRLHMLSSHAQEIAVWGKRALEATHECGDEQITAGILISLGVGRHLAGDVAEGMDLLQQGLDVAQRSGSWLDVGRAYVNMCDCYFDRGDHQQVLSLYDAYQLHVQRTGWEATVPAMRFEAGRARLELGHQDGGFDELVAMSEATMPTVLPLALALHGTWLTRVGRAEEAAAIAERACVLAEHDGVFEKISVATTALMHTRLALGDLEGAATVAERALSHLRPLGLIVGSERLLLAVVESLLAVDRTPSAAEAVDAIDTIAQRAGTPFSRAAQREAHAMFAAHHTDPEASSRWLEAADAWRALSMPYQEARARQHVSGHSATAHSSLQDVMSASTLPGASVSPLTRRECEVLAAIARGESSAQIAATLVLSEHTIHRHVANILTKLQVPTRAAAVALASRHGWV